MDRLDLNKLTQSVIESFGEREFRKMADNAHGGHADPGWFVPPSEGDFLAIVVIVIVLGGLYGIVYLYAAFDRWAEHRAQGTPLAKTIPTLLAIALIYEIFPVDHFHPLLPLSAILIALMADWSRFHLNIKTEADAADLPNTTLNKGYTDDV